MKHPMAPRILSVPGTLLLLLTLLAGGLGTAAAHPRFPAPMFPVGDNPSSVAAADFNGDGAVDLAVTNSTSAPGGVSGVSVLLGLGDGRFTPENRIPLAATPSAIATGDFDKDGKADLAVTTLNNQVLILLGAGDGTFVPRGSNDVGRSPSQVVVADLNRDGNPDLAVATYDGISVLLGTGDGGFLPQSLLGSVTLVHSLVAVDFNLDGNPDLAVVWDGPSEAVVFPGRGDGRFDSPVMLGGPQCCNAWIATSDFDHDGKPDLAVTHGGRATSGSYIPPETVSLLGNGTGGIRARFPMQIGGSDGSWIATGDIN